MVNRMRLMVRLLFGLSLIFLSYASSAQTVRISAPRQVAIGSPFSVTYTVDTKEQVEILDNPNFGNLELLYGPAIGSRHSTTIVNNRVSSSSSTEITYTLMGEQEGSIRVSGFRIKCAGKLLTAEGVTIQIKDDGSSQANTRGIGRNEHMRRTASQAEYHYEALVPRRTVYVQEALPIVYKLYATEEPHISGTKPSTYDGFVSLDLLGTDQRQIRIERKSGKDWATVEILKELLFAQRPGELTIPTNELPILYTLRDPDDPFLNQTSERILKSAPISIKVKPLPQEGRPMDFSGAVGVFSAKYEVADKLWETNKATTLKLTLQGEGNLKIAKLPKLVLPSDIEVYDPTEKSEQSYEAGVLRSKRIIEYNLIPRNTGKVTIPRLSISFFNPSLGKYQTAIAEGFDIQIVQGKEQAEQASAGSIQDDLHQGGNRPYGMIEREGVSVFKFHWEAMSIVYIVLLVVGLIVLRTITKRQAHKADSFGFAASRANKVAYKRLQNARRLLSEKKRDAFLEEALRALWGYLGDRLRLPVSELNRSTIREQLEQGGFDEATILELCGTIDEVEFARFTPDADENTFESLYTRVSNIITTIEQHK